MTANLCKLGLCATAALLTSAAHADDLLIVDLSVANQITISATAGLSAVTISGGDVTGVYFQDFYNGAGNSLSSTFVSGDLTNVGGTPDGTPAIFRAGGGTDTGLNFYSWATESTVTFTAGSQAFSGSATWTVTADRFGDMLAGNSSGNLYFPADDAGDLTSASLIGTYRVVVPAPGMVSLAGIGLGLGAMRRRR